MLKKRFGFSDWQIEELLNMSLALVGANFLGCTKVLSQHHLVLYFLSSPFLPCKDTFMDDYDGI
jgi:hypothetical protein